MYYILLYFIILASVTVFMIIEFKKGWKYTFEMYQSFFNIDVYLFKV